MLDGDPSLDGVFAHLVQFLSDDVDGLADRFAVPSEPMAGINRTTFLMRRDACDRFGWYDETLGTSDFVPWFSRASALGFSHRLLPEVVARRRIHGANTGIVRREAQQQESLLGLRQALALRRGRDPGSR